METELKFCHLTPTTLQEHSTDQYILEQEAETGWLQRMAGFVFPINQV